MALDATTTVVETSVNGLKTLSLSSLPALETTVNMTGVFLTATGIFVIGAPLVYMGVRYIINKVNAKKNGTTEVQATGMNGKVIMSFAVASLLLISVGTAMLPRTATVMVIHIIAGYSCLVISIIHIFQYRNIIKAQSKKLFGFMNAPKKPAPAAASA